VAISNFRSYKQSRGMSAMTDIRDWLGGWPIQFVRDQEMIDHAASRGLALLNIKTGAANTEFLFRRSYETRHRFGVSRQRPFASVHALTPWREMVGAPGLEPGTR
jgi:hypothetical protein